MHKLLLLSLITISLSVAALGQTSTVTNLDLEKYRQQRVLAEADYESKVKSGILPSKAELEKREQERQKFISEFSQKATIARNQAEDYWQAQAYVLRTEIAAVEAEVNYVRARVNEIPQPQVYYSVGYLPYGGYGGYGNCCYGGVGFPQYPINGTSNIQINSGQIGGTVKLGRSPRVSIGGTYGQTSIRQTGRVIAINGGFNSPNTNLTFGGIPYQPGILTAPFTLPTPQNLTREELLARLRLLEQQRAGLYARFNVLQDEAQRGGVKID